MTTYVNILLTRKTHRNISMQKGTARTLWKIKELINKRTVKPFLADKNSKTSRIILMDEEWVISQIHQIAQHISNSNEYFMSILIKIMPKNKEDESFHSSEDDPVPFIIKKYRNYPSIKLIKTKNKSKNFRFRMRS